ncbi:MAG: fused MFS/spermidine synthase [Desulfuromonadales bacterium]|nr:fused MFS/spermidine synthase [Desulfuromonadales bacterium]
MTDRPFAKALVYLIFTLSGFCALVYEVLWSKHLSLTFGTTIYAVSIVTATFMGGIALGSYLIGRYADQKKNLLTIYAVLELGIALSALFFAPALMAIQTFYVFLVQSFGGTGFANALHIFFSAILLLPAAVYMGGTFPIMCRFFARQKSGGQIGRLYAMNTLGAMAGAFCAGFYLIPTFGLSTTGWLTITANMLIAITALILSRSLGKAEATADVSMSKRHSLPQLATDNKVLLLSISAVGFFSLAYEILWTRVFLLFLGNTTYAFALMLSAYLIGIAIGGALYARNVHPQLNERSIFIVLASLMGVSILVTVPFYDQLAYLFQFAHEASGERWWHLSTLSFLIVFTVMGLPTIFSGALLPAAVAIVDPGKTRTGEGVGLVVFCNTTGAVLGSLVAGFTLIPAFGLLNSFRLLAIANILLAIFISYRLTTQRSKAFVPILLVVTLVAIFLPAQWDQSLMNSGVYIYAPKYASMGGLNKILAAEKIIEVIEGVDTTVAVHENLDGTNRFFTVNGKTDGSTGRDAATQILVGHLPMLLHQSPQDVLVIGLGTGMTLKGLSSHPTKNITCVEISPGVVEASSYFDDANGFALCDAKVNLVINDGRNLLLTEQQSYDVIISEPSNPWQSGNSNLFTAEFYELAASRLNSGGILCQWIGLYDIEPGNLKIACNTFLRTFEHVLAFKAGSDLILLGGNTPLQFNYSALQERINHPQISQVLREIEIESAGDLIAKHYLYDRSALLDFAQGAGLNTDDMPILEYSAKYNLGEHTLGEFQATNMQNLLAAQKNIILPIINLGATRWQVAENLRELGIGYSKSGRSDTASHFMRKAQSLEPGKTSPAYN